MKHASRILIAAFLVILALAAAPASSATTVVGGTSENTRDVEWAVAQFADAGLKLPSVVVEFHADDAGCDGYDGVFRGGQDPFRLDICTANRYIILHEFAHAWDRHNMTDEMGQEFMELRGLTVWNGSGSWKASRSLISSPARPIRRSASKASSVAVSRSSSRRTISIWANSS